MTFQCPEPPHTFYKVLEDRRQHASGCALLLAVVDTSVFISGHGVLRRLVEAMEAADDPVRSRDAPPFQLRIQLVVPFQASRP